MKKRLLYITLALVVLVVGINLFTRAEYLSGRIRDMVVEKAREELGYDFGMGRLVFNFFPTYLDIERPYIKGWDPSSPERVITADSARVYFSLGALINGRLRIKRTQLHEARLHLVRSADGGFNTDDLVRKIMSVRKLGEADGKLEGEGPGIGQVVLFDAGLRYDDVQKNLTVIAGNVGADIRLMKDGFGLGCRVKDIVVVHPDTPTVNMEFEGDMVYRPGRVDVGSARLVAGQSRVDGSGSITLSARPEINVSLDADLDLNLLESLALVKSHASGSARIKGVVGGVYPELSGNGELTLQDAGYAGLEVARMKCGYKFDEGSLSVDGIKAGIYGGTLEGAASVDFTGDKIRYSSNLRFADIVSGRFTGADDRLDFIPWYNVSGLVSLEGAGMDLAGLKASGTVMLDWYELPYDASGVDTSLQAVRELDVDFILANKVFKIDSGRAASLHTTLDFMGSIGLDGESDLSISGRSSDVEDISTMIGYPYMDGELDVTGVVTGNILAPVIRGKARISNAYAGGVAFPTAFGDVELSGWRLSFTDFVIKPELGSFNLNGSIYFQGENASFYEPYFDARLELQDVNAREITSIFYEDIPVNLTASGDIAFRGNTVDFDGRAHLLTGEGDVYGQKVDKGEVLAELTETGISFPKVIAVRDRDIMTASGRIGFDGTFDARATSARVNLENFDMLMGTGVPVKGSVSVSVEGGGSFDDPRISSKITAYTLFLKDVDLGAATLETDISKGRLSGKGSLLGDRVVLDGYLELDSPYRWSARLSFEQGRFEPFVRMVYDRLPEDVSFVSTGVLKANGAVEHPENDTASINFTDVTATILGRDLRNQGDISISYYDGGLDVRSLELKGEELSFNVTGKADVEEGFDLDVAAGFDLDGMREVYKDTLDYIDGRCDARFRVRGPIEDPAINGSVIVSGAGVKFREFQQRFDEVSMDLVLEGKVFELKGLEAKFGGGTVSATGRGGLKGILPDNFSFTVTAQDVRLKYPEYLSSSVQAKLFVEGAEDKRSVSGEVIVNRATYTERIEWKSWLLQFRKKRVDVEQAAPGILDDVALNVHVTGPQSIKIDNNVAKIPVTPDLYVRGDIGSPVLLGRMEASGGRVYFRNNAFTLTSAVAEFADPTRLNPIIDLQAETQVREYSIQLTLSGTLDKINVLLLSDPPLEDADIITLLALGRTSEGLEGHEAALTTGEAASFATGQIQDAVEERVRRITGFDRFQIDPYMTSSGVSSGPRMTVGKSLFSEKLYITYSSNLGTSEDQFIRLEYLINKNLSLVGERDELGRFGGDLKLRFDFR